MLVVGQCLMLELVNDRLGLCVSQDSVPGFHQKIEVGVVDVFAEGWVGKDIVNASVGQRQACCCAGVDGRCSSIGSLPAKCFDKAIQFAIQDIPGATLGNM